MALDAACTALLTGECDATMVGGVNVMLTPDVTITFSRASMLSPDGRCKAFDARANGYVRGEGAGIVILKLLSRALLDRDRIHAVIRGTAVNQDGHTSTITVPSRDAQIAMLRQACARAGVRPSHIGYVEAHGTGTAVGDPIEASAIGTVFGEGRTGEGPASSVRSRPISATSSRRLARVDQSGPVRAPRRNSAEPALRASQPSCRFRWPRHSRATQARGVAERIPVEDRSRQFLRLRRHQRLCRGRTAAATGGADFRSCFA